LGGELGSLMEDLCVGGYATSAVYDLLLPDGPATIRSRSIDELLYAWVSHIGIAFDNASHSFLDLAFTAVEPTYDDFMARASALTHGLRKKSQVKDLTAVARFLIGAGADLYFYVSSRTDDHIEVSDPRHSRSTLIPKLPPARSLQGGRDRPQLSGCSARAEVDERRPATPKQLLAPDVAPQAAGWRNEGQALTPGDRLVCERVSSRPALRRYR
jgi:hypothetical protein